MKKLFIVIFCMLMFVGCASSKDVNFLFTWTAPGDDGNIGAATQYDMRYSSDSLILKNWTNATIISVPAPHVAGTQESLSIVIILPTEKTYYFAIKAADEVPNWSLISNIAFYYVPDDVPPTVIINLQRIKPE